jgi:hypothetical protein
VHFGIDVSSNNHPNNVAIDWMAAYNDLKSRGGGAQPFVIVKATQGTGYVNPFFNQDVAAAKAAGFAIGAYLMDQGNDDVAAEEAMFKRVAGPIPQFNDDELPMGSTAYAQHCSQLVAQNPAALDYLNQNEENNGFPPGAGYWEANYNNAPGITNKPALMHQFSNVGQVAGIQGDVDLNAWLGSEQQFANAFAYAGNPTPLPGPIAGPTVDCVALTATGTNAGYLLVDKNGAIIAKGDAVKIGNDLSGVHLSQPIVAASYVKDFKGYRLFAGDGGVFCYGNASYHGGTAGAILNKPICAAAETPSGNGYWMLGEDGGVFCFGDARFFGSLGGKLAVPAMGIIPTPSGNGYWIVLNDGHVKEFGDAVHYGDLGDIHTNAPTVAMMATPSGRGYWLIGEDGGVFCYGDAVFHGGTGGVKLNRPVVGACRTTDGGGYWLVAADGGVFSFGNAHFEGAQG